MCAAGIRGYNAARILINHGFNDVKVYPGGMRFYQSTHYQELEPGITMETISDSGHIEKCEVPDASFRLDCSGMQCPGPIMKVFETIKTMKDGQLVEVTASDSGFSRDIVAWCKRTGNTLISNSDHNGETVVVIRKGVERVPRVSETRAMAEGKTIIVFSGDLDRVLASFIIANGAAAMGRPVTMFFTFWGLNVLRKPQKQSVKKTLIESMFGWMMPRGADKLTLSKMNMGGMGTVMMKKVMKDKNVDSLEALMKQAMKAGVKLVACTMSMDVMGIKAEELIDGVELGGVGAYLGDAEESDVNLFI